MFFANFETIWRYGSSRGRTRKRGLSRWQKMVALGFHWCCGKTFPQPFALNFQSLSDDYMKFYDSFYSASSFFKFLYLLMSTRNFCVRKVMNFQLRCRCSVHIARGLLSDLRYIHSWQSMFSFLLHDRLCYLHDVGWGLYNENSVSVGALCSHVDCSDIPKQYYCHLDRTPGFHIMRVCCRLFFFAKNHFFCLLSYLSSFKRST